MDPSADKEGLESAVPNEQPPQHDSDQLEESTVTLDDDDDDLDIEADEEITDDEAERADGA